MNKREQLLIEALRKEEPAARSEFLERYSRFIDQDISYHSRLGLTPEAAHAEAHRQISRLFLELIKRSEFEFEGVSIRQILHFLTVTLAFNVYSRIPSMFDPQRWPSLTFASRWAMHHVPGEYESGTIIVDSEQSMTPAFLSSVLMPYVNAIAEVQTVCDLILTGRPSAVVIRFIRQQSPVAVSLEGAGDAIRAVREDVIPWRRHNAKRLAELEARKVEAEIKMNTAEAMEIRARSSKERAEALRIKAEVSKLKAEARKLELENQKLELELNTAKLRLALEIVQKMKPGLEESEQLAYAVKLLPQITSLVTSEIENPILIP